IGGRKRPHCGACVARQTMWQGKLVVQLPLSERSDVMSRPPRIPPVKKLRIVLAVLQGEITVAEAARREKVSEQAIGNWKRQFLEAGKLGLEAGKSKPSSREQQLEEEVAELTQALGEAAIEVRVWKKSAEGRLGPLRTSR